MQTWHVVSDSDGSVYAVFCEANLKEARREARYVSSLLKLDAYVHSVVGHRPSPGQSISMRGAVSRG
jgi:hypothetical protein